MREETVDFSPYNILEIGKIVKKLLKWMGIDDEGQSCDITSKWAKEVLYVIQSFKSDLFTTDDLYMLEDHFKEKFPYNNNRKFGLLRGLQILRDIGKVEFIRPGEYKLVS